ncbi:MAG TPA: hypothetical protein VHA76_10350 [Solirubrobacterales bacterium]|nr:hypothetical protein [Solirubrobacterales bacterium]
MNTHITPLKTLLAAAGLAAASLLCLLALSASPAGAAKPKVYECQHPLVTGWEAVNPKGISPKEACVVVRALGKYLSTDKNIETLYECKGATPKKPGRPVLLQTEFEGWHLKLVKGYNFYMTKPGQSFKVTGQDFPVNCS